MIEPTRHQLAEQRRKDRPRPAAKSEPLTTTIIIVVVLLACGFLGVMALVYATDRAPGAITGVTTWMSHPR